MDTSIRARFDTAVGDVLLAVAAVAGIFAVETHLEADGGQRAVDWIAYASILVAGGALVARRRWPAGVLAVVVGALTIYLARDYPGGPVFLTALVPLYTLGATWQTRDAYVAAGVASAWLIGTGTIVESGAGLIHVVFLGWAAAAVFLGNAVRSRRDRMEALADRAAQLEASREDEARRRVAEERLRIARDLHDSVAHAMTAINVQAGTAVHLMDDEPARAREALVAIQRQSKTVLEELGSLIGVVRGPGDEVERAPTPGLADIEELVRATRQAGADVRLDFAVDRDRVSATVGTAAYRIVQESLTNAVRHAGPSATIEVRVIAGATGDLSVEVVDDGNGADATTANADTDESARGRGLIGMRERAESTGGTFTASPRRERGFAVRATWPDRP